MATEKIKLVQGDTRPQLILSVMDQRTGLPIDLSDPDTSTRVRFREVGANDVKVDMPCRTLPGRLDPETGEIDFSSPYDVPGAGGRVIMDWSPEALDTAGEFEAEIETTFADGTIQTAFNVLRFQVREEF